MLRSPRALFIAVLVALPALVRAQSGVAPDADVRVQRLVAAVSETRLRALATTLVGFGTRESMSTTASPTRGIGAARQWIHDELARSSTTLQVSFDTHVIAPQGRFPRQTELRNVMAVLPGARRGASTSPPTTTRSTLAAVANKG